MNLLLLLDVIESNEVSVVINDNCEDETFKKSLFTLKKLHGTTNYLTPNNK